MIMITECADFTEIRASGNCYTILSEVVRLDWGAKRETPTRKLSQARIIIIILKKIIMIITKCF